MTNNLRSPCGRRWRLPPTRVWLAAAATAAWLGALTLWTAREALIGQTLSTIRTSSYDPTLTSWQLDSEDAELPILSPLADPSWLDGYSLKALVSWLPAPPAEDHGGPGDGGRPVNIRAGPRGSDYKLNVDASDAIPLNRSIPDFRNPK